MTEDRWIQILDMIKKKFELLSDEKSELFDSPGTRHVLVFSGDMGEIKLERIIRPKVIDKKTSYSNRIGSGVDVEYIYSEDEFSDFIKAYRFDNAKNDWIEIEVERFYSL